MDDCLQKRSQEKRILKVFKKTVVIAIDAQEDVEVEKREKEVKCSIKSWTSKQIKRISGWS